MVKLSVTSWNNRLPVQEQQLSWVIVQGVQGYEIY